MERRRPRKMIEASQKMINEQNNLIINKHFELQIKTLQNAPTDADTLELLLQVKVKPAKYPID
jgi:hypothetical protein